jgi:hypothetical protein
MDWSFLNQLPKEMRDALDRELAASYTPQFKRETVRFTVPEVISADTEQGGVWEAPAAGKITRVLAYRKSTTGTGGGTIVDVNISGTTIFTTQSRRPTIPYDSASGKALSGIVEAGILAEGSLVTVDVDAIDSGGAPSDLTVVLTVEYSA